MGLGHPFRRLATPQDSFSSGRGGGRARAGQGRPADGKKGTEKVKGVAAGAGGQNKGQPSKPKKEFKSTGRIRTPSAISSNDSSSSFEKEEEPGPSHKVLSNKGQESRSTEVTRSQSVFMSATTPTFQKATDFDPKIGILCGSFQGRQFRTLIEDNLSNLSTFSTLFSQSMKHRKGKTLYEKNLTFSEKRFPEYIQEIKGMAQGSGVPFYKLFLLNLDLEVFITSPTELYSPRNKEKEGNGCSSIMSNGAEVILGHTEDTGLELLNNVFIVSAEILDSSGKRVEKFTTLTSKDGDDSIVNVVEIGKGETYAHCNRYLRIQTPELKKASLSSAHRHKVIQERHPKPENRSIIENILSDQRGSRLCRLPVWG